MILMFAYGNLSESPFKVIYVEVMVSPVYPPIIMGTRVIVAGYTTFASLCRATLEEKLQGPQGRRK